MERKAWCETQRISMKIEKMCFQTRDVLTNPEKKVFANRLKNVEVIADGVQLPWKTRKF